MFSPHKVVGVAIGVLLLLATGGATRVQAGFDASGFITDWLVYGPLDQAGAGTPGVDVIRMDYISNGVDVFEPTMLPEKDEAVTPEFGGASAATGFNAVITSPPAAWQLVTLTGTDTVDVLALFAGAVIDNAMIYGVAYIRNPGPDPIVGRLEVARDDSIQVKVDECEAIIVNAGGGVGAAGNITDRVNLTIHPGPHRVLVKVFNGAGAFGFRLRFTDAAGNPLTDSTTPAIETSTDPAAFSLTEISAGGLTAARSIAPDKVFGLNKTSTVTLAFTKTNPELSDAAAIIVSETLPGNGIVYSPGSGVPAPASVSGNIVTWNTTVGDAVTSGIAYDLKYEAYGSGCLTGEVAVVQQTTCAVPITSAQINFSCVAAGPLNGLILGDIVGGGDGTGSKDPDIWAINTDTGAFMTEAEVAGQNFDTTDTDGINPAPVEDDNFDGAEFVDSVFFMNTATMAISTASVEYTFQANDVHTGSWNHILSNATNDLDKGSGQVWCGGQVYTNGVGIHAASGVTFDLAALRQAYGADKVMNFSTVAGTDQCGAGAAGNNTVTLYIIYSTEDAILDESTWFQQSTGANWSMIYQEAIPPEATFLTLATGRLDTGIGCDHGVFADAKIMPLLPEAQIVASPLNGGPPMEVAFDGSASTAPPGNTLTKYEWSFGDGQVGTGVTISHTYTTRGRFTATLTVTDSGGYTDSDSVEIFCLFKPGDVSPWISTDVGTCVVPGGARMEAGCLLTFGSGSDVRQKADSFHFVYQPKTGDVVLTARLSDLIYDQSARAGIMLRETTDPDSAFGMACFYPLTTGLRAYFLNRPTKGGTVATKSGGTFTIPDAYLKIERVGAELIGSVSPDGATWAEINRVTLAAPPAQLLAGPAVTGRDTLSAGNTATATFCDVTFGGTVAENCNNGTDDDGDQKIDCADPDCASAPNCPKSGFHRGDSNADGAINITDGIYILNFLFLGGPAPPCRESANPNDDAAINITDGIYVLNFLFLGGPAPTDPGPMGSPCGPDPAGSPTDLGCESYTKC